MFELVRRGPGSIQPWSFESPWTAPSLLASWATPAWGGELDVYETDDAVVAQVSVPGVTRDQITIQEQQGMLTVHIEQADERREERAGWRIHGQQTHIWERSIRLPADVHAERAEATLRNGVLTITLPKAAQPGSVRRIPVNGVQPRWTSRWPDWLARLGRWLHWSRPARSG